MPAEKTGFMSKTLRRLPFLIILAAAAVGLIYFRGYLSFETLAQNRERLLALRDAHYLWTVLGFMAIYTIVVVTSFPGAIVLSLTGGFLFGLFPGVIYNLASATIGAILVFLAARSGFGSDVAASLEARGGTVARLQKGLQENQWSVLLTMRLLPVLPFFLSNLVPAFVGIPLSTFAITTALGIIPGGMIYTSLGSGLGEVFARGEVPRLDILLRPEFALPLIGLAVLAALPLVVKLLGRKRG